MTALHPKGARGYLFQLYGPFMSSYADFVGSIHDTRSKFKESCTWGAILSHSWIVKSQSVVASAAMNASYQVWIARLVALIWWLWGSTNCNLHYSLVRNFLMCFVAWLSMMLSLTFRPFAVSSSNFFLCLKDGNIV